MDGPRSLHFVTHSPQCKPGEPSVYFWKARNQIQNFGKPQGLSVYFTLLLINGFIQFTFISNSHLNRKRSNIEIISSKR
ncbi:hypothetical protein Hanom_Chr09g00831021 [Helianthus anomalus]